MHLSMPSYIVCRVRVALDGVNCTLGGSLAALRRHIASVTAHTILQGGDIDFKLSASRGARNLQVGSTTLAPLLPRVCFVFTVDASLALLHGRRAPALSVINSETY